MRNDYHSPEGVSEQMGRVAETAKEELIDPAQDALEEVARRAEEFARQQGQQLEEFVRRQPLTAVGVAFGVGVLATIFVRLKFR